MIFTLEFDSKNFLKELEKGEVVETGVSVEGPAAAYAEVWEWGNTRQTKQGPRTVLGVNPDGERVWLSSQAPYGYIWTNLSKYINSISQQLEKVSFTGRDVTNQIRKACRQAAQEIVEIISESAPVDTGQLSESFKVVEDGDELLREGDSGGSIESRFRRY